MTQAIGLPLDRTKSQPVIGIYDGDGNAVVGATLEMTPGSGTLWYFTTDNALSTSLTSTTSAGMAGFTNVDLGTYELHVSAPGKTCGPSGLSVAGSTPGSVVIQAMPAKMAIAEFVCH
jgi:hypothetical protein